LVQEEEGWDDRHPDHNRDPDDVVDLDDHRTGALDDRYDHEHLDRYNDGHNGHDDGRRAHDDRYGADDHDDGHGALDDG
jgi:hypothetical protein